MKTATKPTMKRSQLAFPAWQREMNPEQLAAIMHGEGPARLLAAAGSGKTRVVTHRIARLVESGVPGNRILALTFSKKAADEMSERVKKLDVHGARVGTWHSLCLEILKRGTRWSGWEIRESTKMELKDVVGYKNMKWAGVDVNKLASFIGRCKANLHAPDSEGAAEEARKTFGREAGLATQAFHLYNEELARKEILTFDDMLVFAAEHLADEENRAEWAARWDFLIQDEAQDENAAQEHLAELLARDHRNYMVVGDVFQAIYGFRGSSPERLARFEEKWAGAVTYWLPRNYRSGDAIITAANGIVAPAKVPGIEPRPMVPSRKVPGEVVSLPCETFDDEGHAFVDRVQRLVKAGDATYSDFTALFRVNAQSRALEEALLGARIPYVVVGGTSFYERKEVRDLLGYVRLAANRGGLDDVARCINAPFRFLGKKFVEKVTAVAEAETEAGNGLVWEDIVLRAAQLDRIQDRQRASAQEWAAIVEEAEQRIVRGAAADAQTREKDDARADQVLDQIVRRTRYLEWLKKEEGEESIETNNVSNVRELIRVAARFPTVPALLDYIDETLRAAKKQREDKQAGGDRVLLMSVHRSKGLEWPHVWVAGFNENILPHFLGDPEEERRLAYVATTRARDSLVLSYVRTMVTRTGVKDAAPSRFLADAFPVREEDSVSADLLLETESSEKQFAEPTGA